MGAIGAVNGEADGEGGDADANADDGFREKKTENLNPTAMKMATVINTQIQRGMKKKYLEEERKTKS